MVDVKRSLDEYGWLKYTITSPKSKATYTVSKAENGYSQYKVSISKGVVPDKLKGKYTTADYGKDAVVKYLSNIKPTATVQRDEKARRSKEWKEKNAAERKPDNQDNLQQGAAD